MNKTRGIYIQGCARSGNTLIRELCGSAFQGVEMVKLTKDTAECSLAHLVELLHQPDKNAAVRVASRNYENSLAMDRDLLRANPDVKILWMLRDPRDILTSIHANQPDKYYVTPDRLIKSLQLYLQFKDEPQVLAVRYEELVGNPDAMQVKISQFCHLTESRKFVEAHKFFPRFHENVRAMHSIRPIDTNSVQKWPAIPRINNISSKSLQATLRLSRWHWNVGMKLTHSGNSYGLKARSFGHEQEIKREIPITITSKFKF